MERKEIEEKVKAMIIDQLGASKDDVTLEASFTNDLGADSLDQVDLIMNFEKTFGLEIPDDIAGEINTVGDAINYIETHLAEKEN